MCPSKLADFKEKCAVVGVYNAPNANILAYCIIESFCPLPIHHT